MSEKLHPETWPTPSLAELSTRGVIPSLDAALLTAPPGHGYCLDIVAEPQWARVGTAYFNFFTGFSGFKVGFPRRLWRGYVLPMVPALLAGTVKLFGHELKATGWVARVGPDAPLRSVDQLVWVEFSVPAALPKLPVANNLTCAPGVRETHGDLNG